MIINFSNLGGGGGGSYVLPVATDSRLGGVKIGSGVNVDSAGTISAQEYTLPTASSEVLGGVKVGSGLTITDGVLSANGGGGDSTALEEITELPESPEDGAVYNYNGTLIKYVDGPGNWGKWYGDANVGFKSNNDLNHICSFNYVTLPASADGAILISFKRSNDYEHVIFDLTNDRLVIKSDVASETNDFVVAHNGAEVKAYVANNDFYAFYVKWEGNIINFTYAYMFGYIGTAYAQSRCNLLDTTTSTGHYELIGEPRALPSSNLYKDTYGAMQSIYVDADEAKFFLPKAIDENGRILGVGSTARASYSRVNGPYIKTILYTEDSSSSSRTILPDMWVPTASGNQGDILVSNGSNGYTPTPPVFKSIQQALGVDFWTGTQDEYDAITTKSATTLYIIIPDE